MLQCDLKNGWELDVVDEKLRGEREVFSSKKHFLDEVKRTYEIWHELNIKSRDADVKVVHCCIPASLFAMIREYVSALIAKKNKCKFIIHFRCTVPNMVKSKKSIFVLKRLCNKSDLIMCLNEQTRSFLSELTKTKQVLIPNFIDGKELILNYEVRKTIKKAVYVGGVIRTKGCDDIVELAKRFPNIEFELIGKADQDMESLVEESHLDNITLMGSMSRDKVMEHLYEADVFLFLSRFSGEGFSNALVEAMAIGLPCLVTDWAANKDMVEDKGGIVVGVRDVDSAVLALNQMQDYESRKKMSVWNQQKARNNYNSRVVTDMYVDTYEEVIGLNNEKKN